MQARNSIATLLVGLALAACSASQQTVGPVPSSPPSAGSVAPAQSSPSQSPVAESGTIRGRLVLAGMSIRPVPGTVQLTGPSRYNAVVGDDGTFTVAVVPGAYVGTGTSPLYSGGKGTCRTATNIAVATGATVQVEVDCVMK